MKVIVWTDEKIEQLEMLWANHSASEIAAILGVTRNAVVGKVHRLELSGKVPDVVHRKKTKAHKASISRVYAPRNSPSRSVDVVKLRQFKRCEIEAPKADIQCLNVAFADIRRHKCHWITNDDSRAPLYCGHDVVAGTNWCPGHYVVVYVPPSERRRERPRAAA